MLINVVVGFLPILAVGTGGSEAWRERERETEIGLRYTKTAMANKS